MFGDPSENRTPDCLLRIQSFRTGYYNTASAVANAVLVSGVLTTQNYKTKKTPERMSFLFGDPSENRTPDTMIKSHVLCQLS